ncbi:T9SS type A sorting domain-containing protein [Bernardetia sp.]|uniref:T9SS type A sorting domain-containing protein n=1 Tax=Bernardetia sp. TaxID=1937974 RepID=UPI0025C01E6A|nr:T9SS type A sorting domain-containing protein [Bernardetia sp.]
MKEKYYLYLTTLVCSILLSLIFHFDVLGQCGACDITINSSVTWSSVSSPPPTAVVCVSDPGANITITLTDNITIAGLELCDRTGAGSTNVTIQGNGNSLIVTGGVHIGNKRNLTINDALIDVSGDLTIDNNGNIGVSGNGELDVDGCFAPADRSNTIDNSGGLTWCVACAGNPSNSGEGTPTDCETLNNPILCNGTRIPGEPDCTTCTSTINSSTGGLNINAGQVVCVQGGTVGSPVSLNNINMNGGDLQICSGVVQGSISNFGSGTLNVLTGSDFDITNSFNMNGNVEINVYGTLDLSGNYNMQNGNNIINVSSSGILSINSLSMTSTNSNPGHELNIVGQVDITTLAVNSGNNSISVENGSLDVGVLSANNAENSFCTNSCGAFTINNSAQINEPISDDSGLLFCYQGGSAISGGSGQPAGGGDGSYAGSATEGCPADCNSVLPVLLTFFDAEIKENNVILRWQTATEYNNSHFFIERSYNGYDFQIIGSVTGQGTTNKVQNYQWIDNNPLDGEAYYRLRQVDADGNYNISSVKHIEYKHSQEEIYIYPNPTQDKLTIRLNPKLQQVKLELIDLSGNVIITKDIAQFSTSNIVWNGLGGLKGLYILRISHQEFVRQHKILFH